jgi:DNA-binding GntR family transcriptional regulator
MYNVDIPTNTTDAMRHPPPTGLVTVDSTLFLTLSEQLAQRIAGEILTERFAPGARLKEVDLATTYGVSRASIREALRLLDKRGLVRLEPRRGARVTLLSAEEVDDLYEIRASLLTVAARRVAARGGRDVTDAARSLLAEAVAHAGDAEQSRYFDAVYTLSQLVAEAAGSERLAALIRSFSQQVARYTRLSLRTVERRRRSVQGWKRLVRAIEAHEPAAAEDAMRELVAGSQEEVRAILRERSRKEAA